MRAPLVVLLLALLAGCGYQLRGSEGLPGFLERTQLVGGWGGALREGLGERLAGQGYTLVGSAERASARLVLEDHAFERRPVSVGGDAEVREYALSGRLRVRLLRPGGEEPEVIALEARRIYEYDPAGVLGQDREQEAIREEIDRDLLRRMLGRLRAMGN